MGELDVQVGDTFERAGDARGPWEVTEEREGGRRRWRLTRGGSSLWRSGPALLNVARWARVRCL